MFGYKTNSNSYLNYFKNKGAKIGKNCRIFLEKIKMF